MMGVSSVLCDRMERVLGHPTMTLKLLLPSTITINQPRSKKASKMQKNQLFQLCCVSVVGFCCVVGMLHNYDRVSRMPPKRFE